MNCPICAVPLQMTDRQGVEIDYCPKCRGIWLDRGELDKIIEMSAVSPRPGEKPAANNSPEHKRHDDDDDDRRFGEHDPRRKRRKGFLGELFDF